MKTAKFFIALLAAALLASCGDEKDHSGDFGQIKVPDTRQLDQTAGADDTQAARGVTFSTEGAWTSSITQTRADGPDWITITPDHGDAAGTYTLKITLEPNTSEEPRSAKITITCGTSKIEITVTQEGTDESVKPAVNALISKIECYYDVEEHPEKNRQTSNYYFEYDGQKRIVSYKWEDLTDLSEAMNETVTFGYPDARTLKLERKIDDEVKSFTATLDAAGRTAELRRDGHSERWTFTYDAQGRCIRCDQSGINESSVYPYSTFGWTDGNLVAFDTYKENGEKAEQYCYTMAYDTNVRNLVRTTSLDLNALLFNVNPGFISENDPIGILLASIDRLGVRSANLTKTNLVDVELPISSSPGDQYVYFYEILPENEIIEWEIDADDRISRVFYTARVLSIKQNIATGHKDIIEDECYTKREIYKIFY